jgi:mono/diheme cytochrome c family protein
MGRLMAWSLALGLVGLALFWGLTQPKTLPELALANLQGDTTRGEQVFYAGGCASCHAAPKAEGSARLVLSGGRRFTSPFGTFLAPNISSDLKHGIGGWSARDLANAMRFGTSPQGKHYFPAFPYTSYAHASLQDIADLHVFLASLPASNVPSQPHEIGFPFNIRRGLGLWKHLFADKDWVLSGDLSSEVARGRYLVEGLGHCSECHTPRGPLGGLKRDRWMAGAPNPEGKGKIPGLTPDKLNWNASDIAYYLETGFTPDFDTAGGLMVEVVQNMAQLPAKDRAAIAAYLGAIPAIE